MANVFILLGGNVGDKSKIFAKTRNLIEERIGIIAKMSSGYATEAWGFESDIFLNQVIILESELEPSEILKRTQLIENELGRSRNSTGYEARTIDIDLLFYDNQIINTSELTIPHPKIGERRFVLIPLNELVPDKCHPVTGIKIADMLKLCQDTLKVERID